MYAIIETGGKQYRVTPGDVVNVESLKGDVGSTVTLDKILLIGGQADKQVLVGTPYVASASLQAEIVEHGKGEKIRTVKYRRRKGYRRQMGHRQINTRLLVTKIDDGQGHSLAFDAGKRHEVLQKASVPTAAKKEAKVKAAPSEKKAKSTATKTTTTKKKTASKKEA